MKEKDIFHRMRKEADMPVKPDSRKLLQALEETEYDDTFKEENYWNQRPNRRWIPVMAMCLVAVLLIGIGIPVYRNQQKKEEPDSSRNLISEGENGKENPKLVWGLDGDSMGTDAIIDEEGSQSNHRNISPKLWEKLFGLENEDTLFCVRLDCYSAIDWVIDSPDFWQISPNYVYEGETYREIVKNRQKIFDYVLDKFEFQMCEEGEFGKDDKREGFTNFKTGTQFDDINKISELEQTHAEQVLKDPEYRKCREEWLKYCEKKKNAENLFWKQRYEKVYQDIHAYLQEQGVKEEPVMENSYTQADEHAYYAVLTKKQIYELNKMNLCYIHLDLPKRPEEYDRRIADLLAVLMEENEKETYRVIVYSTLCNYLSDGYAVRANWYNDDLIRELKKEEITQEFGETFLADIRKRNGIEKEYIPDMKKGIIWYSKYDGREEEWLHDWKVWNDKSYSGGYFKAELTKEQILGLAQDPDVRAIYLDSSDPDYIDISPEAVCDCDE